MSYLTKDDVLSAHAQFGQLDHDAVKDAMGPNWPVGWDESTAIFDPPACSDCSNGQCHMNCGPALTGKDGQGGAA